MSAQRYYKFLDAARCPMYGTGQYHPQAWMPRIDTIVPCLSGYHACRVDQLVDWLGPVLWEVKFKDSPQDAGNKVVGHQIRLVRRVSEWDARTARLFAVDCAERVLPLFEGVFPDDVRPRTAIETARRFAHGEATRQELGAARDAVARAARTASVWAARDAAWAARDAAWDARDAWAAWAARDAARDAARAARDAADTARDARDAEREWQTRHLTTILGFTSTQTTTATRKV